MTTRDTEELPPAFEEIAPGQSIGNLFQPRNAGDIHSAAHNLARNSRGLTAVTHSDEEDEEEPPGYEPEEDPALLPEYEERHLLEPIVSYNVYQINRRLQVVTPSTRANIARPRYRVTARSGPSLFSKKADFTLTRLQTGAAAAAENSPGKDVGFVNFDRAGQLPWVPRATAQILSDDSGTTETVSYDMSSRNFSDWEFTFNNGVYGWQLTEKPTALSLMEYSSNSILARFTYSIHGTGASRGADVGTLDVFGGNRSGDTQMIELVLATCLVPINHWKNMGRHYRNNVTPRNCSVGGPIAMGNSFFDRDGSGSGPRRASNAV